MHVKVDTKFLKSFKEGFTIGDQLILKGKLVVDKWQDKDSGSNREALKVQALKKNQHCPKTLIKLGEKHGLLGSNSNSSVNQSP